MVAPLSSTAWMPISEPSPTVQPCSIAWWPTVTSSPSFIGRPGSVCSTAPSWMLVRAPITIGSLSARSTAPGQTLQPGPSVTWPITVAPSAIQALGSIWGTASPRR